jgi:hypothetical protein
MESFHCFMIMLCHSEIQRTASLQNLIALNLFRGRCSSHQENIEMAPSFNRVVLEFLGGLREVEWGPARAF